MLVMTDVGTGFAYAIVFPVSFGQDVMDGFFRHVAQHFLQYAGHPEFPLHQIADDHHQILAESLEHKQISFDIVYVLTVLFDGVIYFLKERICQSIDISQHFAAACLFGYT